MCWPSSSYVVCINITFYLIGVGFANAGVAVLGIQRAIVTPVLPFSIAFSCIGVGFANAGSRSLSYDFELCLGNAFTTG